MFYIRADANSEIGSGHVMRCISIANALRKKGIETTFITADRNSEGLITQFKYPMVILNSNWDSLEDEIEKIRDLIIKEKINHLLIDSYFVTENYFKNVRNYTTIIYLDDINKMMYPVDILINYNIYADKVINKEMYGKYNTKLLLGCKYAPLREEFQSKRVTIRDDVSSILITTGGSDIYNIAGQLLQYLNKNNQYETITFHVVVGSFNPHLQKLQILEKKYPNIVLHKFVTAMSDMMLESDIAVSAGGSTLYELCSCAVPTISFSYVDNQLYGVKEFQQQDTIYYAGDVREDLELCLFSIDQRLKQLISDKMLRITLSKRMSSLVDGLGATRIADEIFG